ncbi:hypothetical protein NEOC65_001810 [Neochlamydia sp. AcF65]|nr:hypothetical protein [Neochlamydia sp. AcF65]MBS4171492.1 hypothetical protein [Neochlamydia sp. AcF95]
MPKWLGLFLSSPLISYKLQIIEFQLKYISKIKKCN